MENSTAIRPSGSEDARLLIETQEHDVVVVRRINSTFEIEGHLDFEAGPSARWPPAMLDVDGDGLDEAVFGTYLSRAVHIVGANGGGDPLNTALDSEFLPESVTYLLFAVDLDGDDSVELIATTPVDVPEEAALTVLVQQDGWTKVGTPLHIPEIATEHFVIKPLPTRIGAEQLG